MDQPGRAESRAAHQRIEDLLNRAKVNVAEGDRVQARQDVEDAYSACDQIGRGLGESIKPLIHSVRGDLDSDSNDKTTEIDINGALAEVENVRDSL